MLEQHYLNLISGRSRGPLAALARGLLTLAEVPYALAMLQRNRRYDARGSHLLRRPTIGIGNITAGGTGKTPVVQWLADQLQQAGRHPAILMRGYRKAGAQTSDEQTLLADALPGIPVEANPDRLAGAAAVLRSHPQTTCFLLDDGFQHRRAGRDFDLVLINATEPFGFGHVHPRGLLREPLAGLRRASAILITHASEVPPEALLVTQDRIRQYTPAPIFHCDHVNTTILSADGRDTRELSDLATMPFVLFTGIGHPQPLCASLKRFAAAYKADHLFDDHHHYTPADIALLDNLRRSSGAQILLTTEKDWAKLKPLWPQDAPLLYRLQLTIRFWENEQEPLLHLINKALLPGMGGPARLLFTVEETFAIRGRGLVLAPGLTPQGDERFRIGDFLELHLPNGTVRRTQITGLEMLCPPSSKGIPILVAERKEDIPPGTEVWSIGS